MHPAIRTQVDMDQDEYSLASALDASDGDRTRQEFKAETDINVLIKKFGVPQSGRQMMFTDVDYTIDLQQAMASIQEARQAHAKLPDNLRARYPNWRDLLNALDRGELTIHGEEPASADSSAAAAVSA